MKVLVVGNGGREHSLCWKLAQSPLATAIHCAPGSPGTEAVATSVPVAADDLDGLVDFAADEGIDLTFVGPELPLTLGLADRFHEAGLPVFGPRRAAARLEGSKVFAKLFMERHGIPTARFEVCESRREAQRAAARFGLPVVLKADGLAAGKGVLIPADEAELGEALDAFFDERRFGDAGALVVVEECLTGEEVSLIALSDGRRLIPCATSKDYKRIGEGDRGPNTGGMGAHSPSIVLGGAARARSVELSMAPVLRGMAEEGEPFIGVLYAGLMLTQDGPRVLEYNVRFGDPECQPLMLRLVGDLLPVAAAGAAGDFEELDLTFSQRAAACVVLANDGYPGRPHAGDEIHGIERAEERPDVTVFHAGTVREDGRLIARGGRVLDVCATGEDLGTALEAVYGACETIEWPHKRYRRDIGRRVLALGG